MEIGVAYLYTPTILGVPQGDWTQRARLEAEQPAPNQAFGTSVALSRQYLAIAGLGSPNPIGSMVYDDSLPTAFFKPALSSMLWAQYTADTKGDYLDGTALDASGKVVLVGSPAKAGAGNVGKAYVAPCSSRGGGMLHGC